jgi:acyl carrier protein
MDTVESKVKQVIVKSIKGIDVDKIKPECTLEQLGADSLDAVEMILAVEQEFKISISEDDFENLDTVASIINLVNEKTNG